MGHTLHRDQRKTSVPASGSSTKSHKGEVPYCCEADRCRRDKTGILCLHEGIISSPTGRGYQVGNCISDVSLFGLSGDFNYSRITPKYCPPSAECTCDAVTRMTGEADFTHPRVGQAERLACHKGSQTLFAGRSPHPLFARGPKAEIETGRCPIIDSGPSGF